MVSSRESSDDAHGSRSGSRHGGKEIEGSNEQERIANDCFTSSVVAGDVTARQDHGRTMKTRSTVDVKTLDVENAVNR
jgi:hypothetical protein